MKKGRIKKLTDRGFGFIDSPEYNGDLFFHANELRGVAFEELEKDDEVTFDIGSGPKGPNATNVTRVASQSASPLGEPSRALQEPASSAPKSSPQPSRDSDYRFLNPYNFVRLLGEPAAIEAGDNVETKVRKKLLGKCKPPPHDRYVGLSGRITCRLETLSPLFVSDAHGVSSDNNGHKTYRFFRYGDQLAIPASSLRGMIRSVFEAATNSCMIHMALKPLSRHVSADDGKRLWPVRLERENGKWLVQILNGDATFHVAGVTSGERLPAAWVLRYSDNWERSQTKVQNPENGYANRTIVPIPDELNHGSNCWALIEPIKRPDKKTRGEKVQAGFPIWNVLEIAQSKEALPAPSGDQRTQQGWLCITNQNMIGKHDERFFFTANATPSKVEIPESAVREYQSLVRDYQERHAKDVRKRNNPGQKEGNKLAFSRFVIDRDEAKETNLNGALLYAWFERSDDDPQVKYLVPVSVPRVNYERGPHDVLSPTHPHLQPCDAIDRMCPACRTFGWVHPDAKKVERGKPVAYRGRVRFSHATPVGTKKVNLLGDYTLAILSSPKPTTVTFYLSQISDSGNSRLSKDELSNGYDGNLSLSGRKFYRRPKAKDLQQRNKAPHGRDKFEFERIDGKRDDQNRSVCDVLDKGNEFAFEIEYENLSETELGALLWSLELENNWAHRLGYAKPLGFGTLSVSIDLLTEVNHKHRYDGIIDGHMPAPAKERITELKNRFRQAMKCAYGDYDSLDNFADLKALLDVPEETLPFIHYPRSKPFPEANGKNFNWFVTNNRGPLLALPNAAKDTDGFPLM